MQEVKAARKTVVKRKEFLNEKKKRKKGGDQAVDEEREMSEEFARPGKVQFGDVAERPPVRLVRYLQCIHLKCNRYCPQLQLDCVHFPRPSFVFHDRTHSTY
jgi:hypothetical protein